MFRSFGQIENSYGNPEPSWHTGQTMGKGRDKRKRRAKREEARSAPPRAVERLSDDSASPTEPDHELKFRPSLGTYIRRTRMTFGQIDFQNYKKEEDYDEVKKSKRNYLRGNVFTRNSAVCHHDDGTGVYRAGYRHDWRRYAEGCRNRRQRRHRG